MAQQRVTGYSSDAQGAWRAFQALGDGRFDGGRQAVTFHSVDAAIAFAAAYPSWTVSVAAVVGAGMLLTGTIEVSPWLKA